MRCYLHSTKLKCKWRCSQKMTEFTETFFRFSVTIDIIVGKWRNPNFFLCNSMFAFSYSYKPYSGTNSTKTQSWNGALPVLCRNRYHWKVVHLMFCHAPFVNLRELLWRCFSHIPLDGIYITYYWCISHISSNVFAYR